MAYDYGNDSNDYQTRQSAMRSDGYGSSTSRDPKPKEGEAAIIDGKEQLNDFRTSSILGSDNRFFGIKFNPESLKLFRGALRQFSPYISEHIERKTLPTFERILGDPKMAMKASNYAGWAYIFNEQLQRLGYTGYGLGTYLYSVSKTENQYRKAHDQSIAGGIVNALTASSENEVFQTARRKGLRVAGKQTIDTAVSTVKEIPGIWVKMERKKALTAELEKQQQARRLQEMGENASPEEMLKLIESDKELGTIFKQEQSADALAKKLQDIKYERDFKPALEKHISENKRRLKEEAEEMLGESRSKNYNNFFPKSSRNKRPSSERKKVNETIEQIAKVEVAEKMGAWDRSWLPKDHRYSGKDTVTVSDGIRQRVDKYFGKQNDLVAEYKKAEESGSGEHSKLLKEQMAMIIGQMIGEGAGSMLGSNYKKDRHPTAYDWIEHYREELADKSHGHDSISSPDAEKPANLGHGAYLHAILMQAQEDVGKSPIASSEFKSIANTDGSIKSDEEIQAMKDSDLSEYGFLIKHASKRIKDGVMGTMALFDVVGHLEANKERTFVHHDGKGVGPVGEKKSEKIKDFIVTKLDELNKTFHTDKKMEEEEVDKLLADLPPKETMQEMLKSAGDQERLFLFWMVDTILPDDKALAEYTGIAKNKIKTTREKINSEEFHTLVAIGIEDMVNALEAHPELMEAYKISEEELEKVKEVEAKAIEQKKPIEDVSSAEERDEAYKMTLGYLSHDHAENKGSKHVENWQQRVEKTEKLKHYDAKEERAEKDAKIAAKKAEKAAENGENMAMNDEDTQWQNSVAPRPTVQPSAIAKGQSPRDFDEGRLGVSI